MFFLPSARIGLLILKRERRDGKAYPEEILVNLGLFMVFFKVFDYNIKGVPTTPPPPLDPPM